MLPSDELKSRPSLPVGSSTHPRLASLGEAAAAHAATLAVTSTEYDPREVADALASNVARASTPSACTPPDSVFQVSEPDHVRSIRCSRTGSRLLLVTCNSRRAERICAPGFTWPAAVPKTLSKRTRACAS